MRRDLAPHGNFEFNLRELGGAMGDFGTLFPLAIGLIAVCKMDPTSLFVMLGLTNIVTGLVYRLPMPVEPKKVISVSARSHGQRLGAWHGPHLATPLRLRMDR